MADKVELGIVLTADGKGLSGELKVTEKQLKKLKGNLDGVDKAGGKTTRSMAKLRTGANKLKTSFSGLIGVGGGLTALFGGLTAIGLGASFVRAASTAEQYKVRLKALLGSQAEANRLFDEMANYASRVPFEYEKVMESATALAGVMEGGVDEVKEWMPLIGDLAAVSGLSIEETTEQVQRMYSAGAASADRFREKGITAMLGFQAGVSYSAEETRQRLMDAWNDPFSKFKGAADDLGQTWSGMLSMLSDKWFQVRTTIMDAGVFDYFKGLVQIIDGEFNDVLDNTKNNAEAWADAIMDGLDAMVVGFGHLADMWDTFMVGVNTINGALAEMVVLYHQLRVVMIKANPKSWLTPNEKNRDLLEAQVELAQAQGRVHEITADSLGRINRNLSEEWGLRMQGIRATVEQKRAERERETAVESTTGAIKRQKTEQQKLTGAAKDYYQKLIDAQKEQDAFSEKLWAADLAMMNDDIGPKVYAEALEQMGVAFGDAAETGKDEIFNLEEAWKEVQNNLQNGFSDLFVGLFHGEYMSSVKDFAKQVLDIFLKLIADIAAAWVASKIFGGEFNLGGFKLFGGSTGGGILGDVIGGGVGEVAKKVGGKILGSIGVGGASSAATAYAMPAAGAIQTTYAMGATPATLAFNQLPGTMSGGGFEFAAAAGQETAGAGAGFGANALAAAPWVAGVAALGAAVSAHFDGVREDVRESVVDMFGQATETIQTTELAAAVMGDTVGVVLRDGAQDAELFRGAMKALGAEYKSGGDGVARLKGEVDKVRAVTNAWTSEAEAGMRAQVQALMSSAEHTGQYENSAMALRGAIDKVAESFANSATEAAGLGSAIQSIPTNWTTTHTTIERTVRRSTDPQAGNGGGFSEGGIATGPTSGYYALLHGQEAVVPLGGGRTIPVEIRGGGTGANMQYMEQLLEASLRQQATMTSSIRTLAARMAEYDENNVNAVGDVQQQIRAGQ